MRPYLLLAAAVACAGAAAAPASAAACAATADTPYTAGALIHGAGSFSCVPASSGMRVTVCIELLKPGVPLWSEAGCASKTAATVTTTVAQDVAVCYTEGPAFARTVVTGSNAAGDTAFASSALVPVPGVGSCGP